MKANEQTAPPLYRADLFNAAAARRAGSEKYLNANGTRDFRGLAAETGLSVNTIRTAFDGNASKLETLKILADFFSIAWLDLFDRDRELEKLRSKAAARSKKK